MSKYGNKPDCCDLLINIFEFRPWLKLAHKYAKNYVRYNRNIYKLCKNKIITEEQFNSHFKQFTGTKLYFESKGIYEK